MWLKLLVLIAVVAFAVDAQKPRKLHRNFDDVDEQEQLQITPLTDPVDGKDYRLPNTTKPINYDIWISTEIHRGVTMFDGVVTILIEIVQPTEEITLHSRGLTIGQIWLRRSTGGVLQSNVDFELKFDGSEFLVIKPTRALTVGTQYKIQINYKGILRDDSSGFYRTFYTNMTGGRVWLATTQFESTDARHGFPCYDEPAIRATFNIEIQHDETYTAIANSPEESRIPVEGTTKVVTKFKQIPSVQSYLIAYTISDFTFVQNTTGRIPHRIFAKPTSILNDEAKYALSVSGEILSGFEDYLNVSYSLEKMDQAAIPNFGSGAMENWGLVTYYEPYLLLNEKIGRTADKENIIATIAHEFAHQWFGNLVSPAWWSFLWLNEGFATWYANYLLHFVYPEERWVDTFLVDTFQWVMEGDANPGVRPMSYYVESPGNIERLFDNVAYSKSGSVLRMFSNAFGQGTWQKGLNFYLTDRGFNYATPDHLHEGIQAAMEIDYPLEDPIDVDTIMKSWENQAGFPYLTVVRTGDYLIFNQKRFSYTNVSSSSLWWIPINYVVGSNPDFTSTKPDIWMENTSTLMLQSNAAPKPFTPNDWIVVNIQQSGYYRVNYDINLWDKIIDQLSGDGDAFTKIHLFNRAQLIDDSFHFARAGLLKYDVLLHIMKYLQKETDYIPWATANRVNALLHRWVAGSSIHSHYQVFMRQNVEKFYLRLGATTRLNEPRVDRYARTVAINIACQAQSEVCLNQTYAVLQTSLGINSMVPDLMTPIYCNGIRIASRDIFIATRGKISTTTIPLERNAILAGLGCTQNPELLREYLNWALDSNAQLSVNDRYRIIISPLNLGDASLRVLISFMKENYQAIDPIYEISSLSSNIAIRVSNEAAKTEFNEVLDFLQSNNALTEPQVNNYKSLADGILDWQSEHLKYFEQFFEDEEITTVIPPSSPATSPQPLTSPATSPQPSTSPETSPQPTTESITTTLGAGSVVLSTAILIFSMFIKFFL